MKISFPGILQLVAATSVFSISILIYEQKLKNKKNSRSDNSIDNENKIVVLNNSEMTTTIQGDSFGGGPASKNLQTHPGEGGEGRLLIHKDHNTSNVKSWISYLTSIFLKISEDDSTRNTTFIQSQSCYYQGMNINLNQHSQAYSKMCSHCPLNIQTSGLTAVHLTTDDFQEIIEILPSEKCDNYFLPADNNDHKQLPIVQQPVSNAENVSTEVDGRRNDEKPSDSSPSDFGPGSPVSESTDNSTSSNEPILMSETSDDTKVAQNAFDTDSHVDLETIKDDVQDNIDIQEVDDREIATLEDEEAFQSKDMYFDVSKCYYQFTGSLEHSDWNDRAGWYHQRSFSPILEDPEEDDTNERSDSLRLNMNSSLDFSSRSTSTSSSDLIFETMFSTSRGAEMNDNDLIDLQDDPDFQSLILQEDDNDLLTIQSDEGVQSRHLEEDEQEMASQSLEEVRNCNIARATAYCNLTIETQVEKMAHVILAQAQYEALSMIMANRKPRTTITVTGKASNISETNYFHIETYASKLSGNVLKEILNVEFFQFHAVCQNSMTILQKKSQAATETLSIATALSNKSIAHSCKFKRPPHQNVLSRSKKVRLRHHIIASFEEKQISMILRGVCFERKLRKTNLFERPMTKIQREMLSPPIITSKGTTKTEPIWISKRKLKKPLKRLRPETFSKLPIVIGFIRHKVINAFLSMKRRHRNLCSHRRNSEMQVLVNSADIKDESYVTSISNDKEVVMGLILVQSLRLTKTRKRISTVVGSDIGPLMRQLLTDVFDHVYLTSEICSYDDIALSLMGRPELGATFTKLHCWRLTQFKKCVYLDADTLVLANCDELFEREELSAVPDTGWPDCFNSGVFVFQPSLETYAKLVTLATTQGSFDGGDQGLLNTYFSNWRSDLSRRLPFIYNMMSNVSYTYAPAYKYYGQGAKIVHFLGSEKPWMVRWRTDTGDVVGRGEQDHPWELNSSMLNRWIEIFKTTILPKLPEVAQSLTNYSTSMTVTQLLQKIYSKEIKEDEAKSIWNRGDSLLQEYFPSHYDNDIHFPPPPIQSPVHLSHYEVVPSQTPYQNTPSQQPRPPSPPSHPQDYHRDTETASFPQEPSHQQHPQDYHRDAGTTLFSQEPSHQEHHQDAQVSSFPREPSQLSTEIKPQSSETAYNERIPENVQGTSEPATRSSHSTLTLSIIEEPSDPHWEALLWHTVQNPWVPPSPPPSSAYNLPSSQLNQPLPDLKPTFGWFSADSDANREWQDPQDNQSSAKNEERTSEDANFENVSCDYPYDNVTGSPKPPTEHEVESDSSSHITMESAGHHQRPLWHDIQITHKNNYLPVAREIIDERSISNHDKHVLVETEQSVIEQEPLNLEEDETNGEQSSILHMRQWEEGNIDYLGKDRFENIWTKLQLMLSSPEPSLPEVNPSEENLNENAGEKESITSLTEDESDDKEDVNSVPEESESDESELWLGYPEGDFTGMINWQEGRIDYCGRDRSDNIMRRLDDVISGDIIVPNMLDGLPMSST